jgi:hypothetical protein
VDEADGGGGGCAMGAGNCDDKEAGDEEEDGIVDMIVDMGRKRSRSRRRTFAGRRHQYEAIKIYGVLVLESLMRTINCEIDKPSRPFLECS